MAVPNSPTMSKIMVDGIDVTSYRIKLTGHKDYSEAVGQVTLTLVYAVDAVLTVDDTLNGKEVTFQRGVNSPTEYYKFRGIVTSFKRTNIGYEITCRNKGYLAQTREFTKSFDINIDPEAGVLSEIGTSIINDYTELIATSSSVQNSGTTVVLNKFVGRHSQCFERVDDLMDALDWQHYYNDYDDLYYMEPRGFIDDSLILEVGVNVTNSPTVSFSADKLVNSLTVIGAQQSVQTTEYFDGTAANGQNFQLTKTPTSVKIYAGSGVFTPGSGNKPSNNETNLRVGGKVDSTSGSFDYTYDPSENVRKIYFYDSAKGAQPSYTPASGTSNIEVQYLYDAPSPVFSERQDSIDAYGIREKTIKKDDIKVVRDAEVYADKYLDRFQTPFPQTTVNVIGVEDLKTGRRYRFIDAAKGYDFWAIATKVEFQDPFKPDVVTLGENPNETVDTQTDLLDRVKRLEENESNTADLLIHLITFSSSYSYENRYAQMYRKGISGSTVWGVSNWSSGDWNNAYVSNGFVLGSGVSGVLGTSSLGEPEGEEILSQLIPGENTFKEYIYDTEFYDSAISTGVTWNTSSKEITIVDGILYTKAISYGVTYSTIKVTIQTDTLDAGEVLSVRVSADGKSTWQDIDLVTLETLSASNTSGVYLEITSDVLGTWPTMFGTWGGSSAIKILNTYNVDGTYKLPGIKVELQ